MGCDDEIVSGEVTFRFYDNALTSLTTYTTKFKQDASKDVVIQVASKDIPDAVAEYKIDNMYVKSKTASIFEIVMYSVSGVYAIFLIALLRVNILSHDYNGKKVEVFAGLVNNRIKIDGKTASEEKKFFSMKPIVLQTTLDDGTVVYAQILANHKISLYTKAAEVNEDDSKIVADESAENVFEVKDKKEDIKKVPQGYFEEDKDNDDDGEDDAADGDEE